MCIRRDERSPVSDGVYHPGMVLYAVSLVSVASFRYWVWLESEVGRSAVRWRTILSGPVIFYSFFYIATSSQRAIVVEEEEEVGSKRRRTGAKRKRRIKIAPCGHCHLIIVA